MKLYKKGATIFLNQENTWFRRDRMTWDALINRRHLYDFLLQDLSNWEILSEIPTPPFDAPISGQEIWAAGVTYLRSKVARMEESELAGGGDFYDRVYDAERPELFFKATAARTVGSKDYVFIRRDSHWDVPEPELVLFCSSAGTIEGYSIGNDMSSRSIEGENPLYLPQAKTYDRCAGLGPCIWVSKEAISPETIIEMRIQRGPKTMYADQVAIRQMKRSHTELVSFLFRENSFPKGCFLMTGTCLVPADDFSLQPEDIVCIKIDPIGELVNRVSTRDRMQA